MRSRLLAGTAMLIAGLATASAQSAQNTPGGARHLARSGVHDALRSQPSPQPRHRAPDTALRTAELQAVARRSSAGQSAPRNGRRDLLPPVKHNDASLRPTRDRPRSDRNGLTTDRSVWDRSFAQGRLRPTQDRPEHRHSDRHRPDDLSGVRSQAGAATTHRDRRSRSPRTSKTGAAEANATKIGAGEADIRKVQEALKQQGFNIGDVDGKLGRHTKDALIAFQKQHGFQTTGKVDRQTLQALNAGAPAAGPGGSPATPAASAPQGAEPATTGQGGGAPPPAAVPQPVDEMAPPAPAIPPMPDNSATGRVPSGSPQDDDTLRKDKR